MKKLFVCLLLASVVAPLAGFAQVTTSTIYECHFQDPTSSTSHLRLKEYFDPSKKVDLGNVDLYENGKDVQSTSTAVYQIMLTDQKTYIQIWYDKNIRVDAQMQIGSPNLLFAGTYNSPTQKHSLLCSKIVN